MSKPHYTREQLAAVFAQGPEVKGKQGKILGKGLFAADLLQMGFTKPELKKLVAQQVLQKVYTTHNNSHHTVYVLG